MGSTCMSYPKPRMHVVQLGASCGGALSFQLLLGLSLNIKATGSRRPARSSTSITERISRKWSRRRG